MKIAHTIEVNAQTGKISIDGLPFPFHILEDPEIVLLPGTGAAALQISVIAHNLTYVSKDGETRVISQASDTDELAWARERGREIVRDGLAEIIAQLR